MTEILLLGVSEDASYRFDLILIYTWLFAILLDLGDLEKNFSRFLGILLGDCYERSRELGMNISLTALVILKSLL